MKQYKDHLSAGWWTAITIVASVVLLVTAQYWYGMPLRPTTLDAVNAMKTLCDSALVAASIGLEEGYYTHYCLTVSKRDADLYPKMQYNVWRAEGWFLMSEDKGNTVVDSTTLVLDMQWMGRNPAISHNWRILYFSMGTSLMSVDNRNRAIGERRS